jgi:restriction system protein
MAAKRRKSSRASDNKLLEKGLLATFIGIALLCAPLVLGGSPMLRAVVQGLSIPAWVVLGLGLVLLVIDRLLKVAKAGSPAQGRLRTNVVPGSRDMFPPEIAPAPGGTPQPMNSIEDTQAPLSSSTVSTARLTGWEAQVFELIEWRRFEAICERLFAQAGFLTKSQSHGADGGVDIWLYSKNLEGPAAVVQCKHWVGRSVGVKEVREFLGVMTSQSVKRGTYVTSSTFTPAASEFARDNNIHLLDRDGLLSLIAKRSDEQQRELLAVAYEGEFWRPTCASCGVKMVERTASKDQCVFWGCVNFPRCRSTLAARKTGAIGRSLASGT